MSDVRVKLNVDPRPSKEEPMIIHGGAGSGNFGHEGRPGELGGSGGGGGGKVDGAKTTAVAKPYDWKRGGRQGTSTARFRFDDEKRGETFFDNTYALWSPKPGEITVQSPIEGRRFGDGSKTDSLKTALTPGTILSVTPGFLSPRGQTEKNPIRIRVDSVEKTEYKHQFKLKYTQIKEG